MASTHIWHSLKTSGRDVRLLWASAWLRMVAFGLTSQFLALYLKELGIKESKIGLFMSLTLIGDSILSYVLTWNALVIGNRNIMIVGCLLMILSSMVFASGTTNFHYLLVSAILGVISPSGNETGPFKTIEETALAHLTPPNHRPEIYALHWVIGTSGSALGSLFGGVIVKLQLDYGLSLREAYQNGFLLITFVSIVKFISMLFISHKVELDYKPKYQVLQEQHLQQQQQTYGSTSGEQEDAEDVTPAINEQTITGLSKETQNRLIKLLVPFMLDSFGYGFMPTAWTIYYFKYYLLATPILLGIIFSSADLLMSISSLPSAFISKKLGPIKATLLTQFPCALIQMIIPLLGANLPLVSAFYLFNQTLTAFDVVPRQIILTTLFKSNELPKVLGTVNIGKQVARSISPYFTGVLAQKGLLWCCFFINGGFLFLANAIVSWEFRHLDKEIKSLESVHHDM